MINFRPTTFFCATLCHLRFAQIVQSRSELIPHSIEPLWSLTTNWNGLRINCGLRELQVEEKEDRRIRRYRVISKSNFRSCLVHQHEVNSSTNSISLQTRSIEVFHFKSYHEKYRGSSLRMQHLLRASFWTRGHPLWTSILLAMSLSMA